MSKSWNTLIISKDLIIPLRLQKEFETLKEKFLQGYSGVALDKKRSSNKKIQFYTFKLSRADRVLVTPHNNALVVLSIIEFHRYDMDPYLGKPKKVPRFLNALTLENTISFTQPFRSEKSEIQPLELEAPSFSTQVFFTEEQQQLLGSNRRFINGVPGAGKTYLALEEIYNCYLEEGPGTIFYVANNEALVRQVASMWKNIEALPQDCTKQVKFLTFTQWLQSLFPEEKNKGLATLHSFQEWLKKYNTTYQRNMKAKSCAHGKGKKHAKTQVQSPIFQDPQLVYKEFTLIHYMTQDEYFKKGVRQTLFSQENRKALWDAFQIYKQHLTQEGLFDPQLFSYTLSEEQADAIALIIFDEYQDLENLAPIIRGSFTRFICFGDGHQQMNPGLAMLPEYYEESAPPLTLTHRFRPSIANFGNAILELKSFMVGGLPKGYYQKIESNFCAMETDFNDNSIILLREFSQEDRRAIADAADLKIITDEKHYPEAIQLFPVEQIYLAHDFKGLESPQILLFKLFDNPTFKKTNKILADAEVQLKANGPMEYAANRHFIPAFNLLYVAATRGQKLYIYNDVKEAHQFKNLIGFFQKKEIRMIETSFLRSLSLAPQEDVNWLMRVTEALDNNDEKRAKLFFIKHIEASETKWNNFLSKYQEQWCQKNQDLGNLIDNASNNENHPINKYQWLNEFDPQVFKEYLSDPQKLRTLFHAQGETLPIFYDLFCQKSTSDTVVAVLKELLPQANIKEQLIGHLQMVYNRRDLITHLMSASLASAVHLVSLASSEKDLLRLIEIEKVFQVWKISQTQSSSPFSLLLEDLEKHKLEREHVIEVVQSLKNYSIDFMFTKFLFTKNPRTYGFIELAQSEPGAILLSHFLCQKKLSDAQKKIIQNLMHQVIKSNDTLFTLLSATDSQIEILLLLEPIGFEKVFTKDILMKYLSIVEKNLCKPGKGLDFLLIASKYSPSMNQWLAPILLKQKNHVPLLKYLIDSDKAEQLLNAIHLECVKTSNRKVIMDIARLSKEALELFSPFNDLQPASLHEMFQSAEEVKQRLFTQQHDGLPLFFWLLSKKHVGLLDQELKLLSVHSPIKKLITQQLLTVHNTVCFFHQIFCFGHTFPFFLTILEGSPWLFNQLHQSKPTILFESYSFQANKEISVLDVILGSQNYLKGGKIELLIMQQLDKLKPEHYQRIADEYLFTKKESSKGNYGIQLLLKSALGSKILKKLLQSGMRLNESVCLEIFHKKVDDNAGGHSIFTYGLKDIDLLFCLLNKLPNLYLTLNSKVLDATILRDALPFLVASDKGVDLLASLFENSLNLNRDTLFKNLIFEKTKNSVQGQADFVEALCHQTHGYRLIQVLYNGLFQIEWGESYQTFLKIICENLHKMFIFLLAPHETTSLLFSIQNTAYISLIETLSQCFKEENRRRFISALFKFLLTENHCGQLIGQILQSHTLGFDFLWRIMAICMKNVSNFYEWMEQLEDLTPQKKDLLRVLLNIPIPTHGNKTFLGYTLVDQTKLPIVSKFLQKIDQQWDLELTFSGMPHRWRESMEKKLFATEHGKIIKAYLSSRSSSTSEAEFSDLFQTESKIEMEIEVLCTPHPQTGIPPFCSFMTKDTQEIISLLKKLDDKPSFQNLMAARLLRPLIPPQNAVGRSRNMLISLIINKNNRPFIEVLNHFPWLINQESVKSLLSFHPLAQGEGLHGILPIVHISSSLYIIWEKMIALLEQMDFFTDFLFSKIEDQPLLGLQLILHEPQLIVAVNKHLFWNKINNEKIVQGFLADDLKRPLLNGFLDYNQYTESLLFLLNKIPNLQEIVAHTLFSKIIDKDKRFSYKSYLDFLHKNENNLRILIILLNKGYLEHLYEREEHHTPIFAAYLYQLSLNKADHPLLRDFFTSNISAFQHLLWLLVDNENPSLLCALFQQDLIEECSVLPIFEQASGYISFAPDLVSKIYLSLEQMLDIQEEKINCFNSEKNCVLLLNLLSLMGNSGYEDNETKMVLKLGLIFIQNNSQNHSYDLNKLQEKYPSFMSLFLEIYSKYSYSILLKHLLPLSVTRNFEFIKFILTLPHSQPHAQGKVTLFGQALEKENSHGSSRLITLLKQLPEEYKFSYSEIFPGAKLAALRKKSAGIKKNKKLDKAITGRLHDGLEPNKNSTHTTHDFWHSKKISSPQSKEAAVTPPKP